MILIDWQVGSHDPHERGGRRPMAILMGVIESFDLLLPSSLSITNDMGQNDMLHTWIMHIHSRFFTSLKAPSGPQSTILLPYFQHQVSPCIKELPNINLFHSNLHSRFPECPIIDQPQPSHCQDPYLRSWLNDQCKGLTAQNYSEKAAWQSCGYVNHSASWL